ncbi:MAG: hypothetical protein J7559_22475 [Cohnella sp.]|nr:hypothetical protein [Cohnella sp.]
MTPKKQNPTSEEQTSYGAKLAQVIVLYQQCVAGNKQALNEADEALERLRDEYPDRPLADAYHGGIMILKARDKRNPLLKLRSVRKGLKLLDNAVAAAPQDLTIRLLRGKAAYHLPEEHFRRTTAAIEDYHMLLQNEDELKKRVSPEGVPQLIDELGDAYFRVGRNLDAANCWRRLEQQTEYPAYQQLARTKLKSVEGKPPVEQVKRTTDVSASSILIGLAAGVTGNVIMNMTGIGWNSSNSRRSQGSNSKSNSRSNSKSSNKGEAGRRRGNGDRKRR